MSLRLLLGLILAYIWTGFAPAKDQEKPKILPDFQLICPTAPKLCAEFKDLKTRLDSVAPEEPTPAVKPSSLTPPEIALLNEDFLRLRQGTDSVLYDQLGKWSLGPAEIQGNIAGGLRVLRARINNISLAVVPLRLNELSDELSVQENRAAALAKEIASASRPLSPEAKSEFSERLRRPVEDAERLWKHLHDSSLVISNMDAPIASKAKGELTPSGQLVLSANALQERMAKLRDRLLALGTQVGLGPPAGAGDRRVDGSAIEGRLKGAGLNSSPFGNNSLAPPGETSSVEAQEAASRRPPLPGSLTVSPHKLFDVRGPPALAEPTEPLPARGLWERLTGKRALFTGKTTVSDGKKIPQDAFPEETKRISKLRGLGLTKTVGDPGGRAKYGFLQTGGTCAIASQAQMYAEIHGMEPTPSKMKRLEDEFYAKAAVNGFFTGNFADPNRRGTNPMGFGGGGTPDQNLGDLLGVPIKKHYLAKPEELEDAVKGGKMVLATARANYLWNDEAYQGYHAFVITGAETNRLSGEILGYYINDTGTGDKGRFVTANQFLKAWELAGRTFVETL